MLQISKHLLLVMSFYHMSHCLMKVQHFENKLLESSTECIIRIAKTYFRADLPIMLMIPYEETEESSKNDTNYVYDDFIIGKLNLHLNHSFLILDYIEKEEHVIRSPNKVQPGSYVLILKGSAYKSFAMAIKMVKRILIDARNPSANLLVVSINAPKSRQDQLSIAGNLLKLFWKRLKISDAIAMVPSIPISSNAYGQSRGFEIFNWFPKKQRGPCFRTINHITKLDHWALGDQDFKSNNNLFPVKHIKDMNGCNLDILLKTVPPFVTFFKTKQLWGTIPEAINTIKDVLNFSINYVRNIDYTPDISAPILYSAFSTQDNCSMTYAHHTENIKWFVPAGAPFPKWKSLTRIFSPLMWTCVVVTFISGSLTFWLLFNATRRYTQPQTFCTVLMNTLLTYLGVGIRDKSKGPLSISFFILWLFYCMLINTAYQSSLIGFLANPGEYPPIRSIEELLRSDLSLLSTFVFSDSTKEGLELNSYEKCPVIHTCAEKMVKYQDTALLVSEFKGSLIIRNAISYGRKSLIVPIDENVHNLIFGIKINTFGCMLRDRVDDLMHRLFTAGITNKARHDLMNLQKLVYTRLSQDPFKFTLSDLQGAFYLIALGIIVAFTVFIFEMIINIIITAFV
ncbi:Ionotropic receptor 431 [Blattella germanica]|nr:Ionotropic receptor 431 [Blattella germanica]